MIFDERSSTIYRAFPVGRCGILRTLGAHKGVPAIRYEMADRNPITAVRQSALAVIVPFASQVPGRPVVALGPGVTHLKEGDRVGIGCKAP